MTAITPIRPPTGDEIDDLLSRITWTSYASEAVEIVETWIERRYGVVGHFTAKERAEHRCCVNCGQRLVKCEQFGPIGSCCVECKHPEPRP